MEYEVVVKSPNKGNRGCARNTNTYMLKIGSRSSRQEDTICTFIFKRAARLPRKKNCRSSKPWTTSSLPMQTRQVIEQARKEIKQGSFVETVESACWLMSRSFVEQSFLSLPRRSWRRRRASKKQQLHLRASEGATEQEVSLERGRRRLLSTACMHFLIFQVTCSWERPEPESG